MAIKRDIWKKYFTKYDVPRWPCPNCRAPLKLEIKTLKSLESALSNEARGSEAWEPDWYEARFCALLSCLDNKCNDTVAVIGDETTTFINDNWETEQRYFPRYFFPALHIFEIPQKVPPEISENIVNAFSAFWNDTSCAANRIRYSVESLLTHRRIARYKTAKRKRIFLTLHERIDRFEKTHGDTAKTLRAVKWLGNEGTHNRELTQDEIFDALELLEDALIKEFVKPDQRIQKLRKRINKRKGKKPRR